MGHLCGKSCKRKTGERCDNCRSGSKRPKVAILDAQGKPVKPAGKHPHATPHEIGAAVDMYFDDLSYRRVDGNRGQYFGRDTGEATVYRWVRDLTETADEIL